MEHVRDICYSYRLPKREIPFHALDLHSKVGGVEVEIPSLKGDRDPVSWLVLHPGTLPRWLQDWALQQMHFCQIWLEIPSENQMPHETSSSKDCSSSKGLSKVTLPEVQQHPASSLTALQLSDTVRFYGVIVQMMWTLYGSAAFKAASLVFPGTPWASQCPLMNWFLFKLGTAGFSG